VYARTRARARARARGTNVFVHILVTEIFAHSNLPPSIDTL